MLERIRNQPWMVATIVLAVALVVALVALIGSDGDDGGSDEVPVTEEGTTTTTTPGEEDEPAPVTTSAPADGAGANLAVIVDNAPGARPQVGLGEAELLVEYPVEGGITRFAAVFPAGSPGLVGPVRSLRPVNTLLLPALTTAVVSTGGQSFVVDEMTGTGVTSVTPDLAPGFVGFGRPSPHDFFIDLEQLADVFEPFGSPAGLPAGTLPDGGGSASRVSLPFEATEYVYDADSGYVRYLDGQPYEVLDPQGSESVQVVHDVVVVLHTAERPAGYSDTNGVPVSSFDVVGSGEVQVFHEGRVVDGTWSRAAVADPFLFFDPAGEPFGLPGGRVYLAVVPRGSEISIN